MAKNSQTIAASYLREHFADVLSQVAYKGKTFLVSKHNRIIAKLSPMGADGTLDGLDAENLSVLEEGQNVKVRPLLRSTRIR